MFPAPSGGAPGGSRSGRIWWSSRGASRGPLTLLLGASESGSVELRLSLCRSLVRALADPTFTLANKR
jgi:hypothetical protein